MTGAPPTAWAQQLKAIAALVRACPVFKDIRGYYPWLVGCVDKPGGGIGQYGGTVHFLVWLPVAIERTPTGEPGIKKEWKYNHPGGISLTFRVSAYVDMGFSWHHREDNEGPFSELPETSRGIGGFPVIGGFLFISLPGKPPLCTPITQERAQRWIADNRREQDLKAAATPKPGGPEARPIEPLTQLESRLASMSPAERRQPARYKPHPEDVRSLDYGGIVEAGRAGAPPLVVPNPDFYDKSPPKTAMQLVSLPWIDEVDSNARKGGTERTVRVPLAVIGQMDWRAVAATLE